MRKTKRRSPRFLLSAIFIFSSASAGACPDFVKKLRTNHLPSEIPDLCAAVDRYQNAIESLETKGFKPAERIADLHATRMINPPTWLQVRESSGFDPWHVYKPAPDTWASWEVGAQRIDSDTKSHSKTQQIPAFSLQWLTEIHRLGMQGVLDTAGKFRTTSEVGKALSRSSALTAKQAAGVVATEYPALVKTGSPMMSWRPTECIEDRSPEFVAWFKTQRYLDISKWPAIEPNRYFKDANGVEKQCGFITYAAPEEVPVQIQKWLQDINSVMASWATASPSGDPLRLSAKAQRWFIAIHPYERGNGRVSRFAMEWVLKSLGLPSPIFRDMDEDIYSTESEWADEIGVGLWRAIKVAEACAANPQRKGCNIVPLIPKPLVVQPTAGVSQP